jgi:hypothetical protein
MLEALCRQSSTTLDIVHAEDGPPITQRTSGLERPITESGAKPRGTKTVRETAYRQLAEKAAGGDLGRCLSSRARWQLAHLRGASAFLGRSHLPLRPQQVPAQVIDVQPLHRDDYRAVFVIVERDNWTVLNLAAIAEKDETIRIGENEYYQRKVGEPLHAARHSAA